jgi:heavy metal translocating P-type ATPase
MIDIAVAYPREGAIQLQSRFLFSDPENESCQLFLQRLSLVEQVQEVAVNGARQLAEVLYCPRSSTRREAVDAIRRCLAGQPRTNGSPKNGARKNGSPKNGDHNGNAHSGNGSPKVNGQQPIRWRPNANGELRLFRHGSIVSTWEVKHEIPGRMRLRNEALHRKAEICQAIERELMSVLGIDSYQTNPMTSSVLVIYNEQQLRREQVFEILNGALSRIEHDGSKDQHDTTFALCSLSMPLAATAQFLVPPLFPVAACLFLYTSVHTFKEAYNVLFHERRLGVDVLDAIVVMACLGTGQVFAGSVLCWCLCFGRVLVKLTQDNSKRMLMSVFGKQARFVWLCRNGAEVEVPLEEIKPHDVIVVNTGEAVPVDGVIKEGIAMIDQHALTGESTPAEKVVGDRVFASTMLVAGKIYVEVEKAGSDTTSAKIAAILNDSAGYKLDSQNKGEKLADKAVIPTLALGALGLGVMGPGGATAVLNSDFGTGIRMAAPLAMLSSLTLCAQHGILVKDGRAMDLMNEVDTVLFDKTGTLTREVPEVGAILTCGDHESEQILTYAAAAENRFAHPIAKAILQRFAALQRPLPATDDSKYHVGFGITVSVDGKTIRVGSGRFMKMEGIKIPAHVQQSLDRAHDEGYSLVMVAVGNELGGALELRASHRPEAQGIVQGLRERGIGHLAIISGDHEGPTRKLSESLGMDEYFAGVLPGDKADYVERLQKRGRKVCFVGDGINDSIALKKANVSVSLRGATSIATDTAQVVFMEESLAKLCDFLDISRNLDKNVRRSWGLIIVPNALCIAGAFTMGFGIMASVLTNNVAAIAALANGMLPLRDVARLQAQKDFEQQIRLSLTAH